MKELRESISGSKKLAALFAAFCVMLACSGALYGCSQENKTESSDSEGSAAASTITVEVIVDSSRAADQGFADTLFSGEIELPEGSTVQDALEATELDIDASAGYVTAIEGLDSATEEYPMSGWLYFVDGEAPTVGSTEFNLEGGENIQWIYTPDFNVEVVPAAA